MPRTINTWRLPFIVTTLLAAVLLAAAACTPANNETNEETATIQVFAAASLADAFKAIGADFAATHGGVEVVFNFGGSNQLATQIDQGAPADVFASANAAQMQAVIAGGRIASGSAQTFVRNQLVVVAPAGKQGGPTTLADLARPGLKIVFAAAAVPAGQYAQDFLAKAAADESLGPAYKAAVLANVVSYEENVRAVLAKVALGEADAGIVYLSDAAALNAAGGAGVRQIEIPAALNTIAEYPIAILPAGPNAASAQAFVAFVLGPEGQQVLARYGFLPADEQ